MAGAGILGIPPDLQEHGDRCRRRAAWVAYNWPRGLSPRAVACQTNGMDETIAPTNDELLGRLAEHGLQASVQRLAVLRHVLGSDHHTTAEELFEELREQPAMLSRATVYNNLSALTAAGLLERLDTPQGTRYGRVTRPHVNLICTGCGNVSDVLVADSGVAELMARAATAGAFTLQSVSLSVMGLCAGCAQQNGFRDSD